MDTFFIFGAKYLYILSLIIGAWFFYKFPEKRKLLIFGICSAMLALIIAKVANQVYINPRPFVAEGFTPLIPHAPDNGFPSDHMLLVSLIPAVIIYYSRKYAIWLWLIAILVGVSSIYVGVHHTLDINGSVVIAIFSAALVHFGLKKKGVL